MIYKEAADIGRKEKISEVPSVAARIRHRNNELVRVRDDSCNNAAFRFDHLEVSKRVFSSLRSGSFVPLDTKDADVVRLALGRVDQRVQAGVGVS